MQILRPPSMYMGGRPCRTVLTLIDGDAAYHECTVSNKLLSMQHRNIRELAYKLWLARGCPDGSAEKDWLAAERQLSSASAASSTPSSNASPPTASSATAAASKEVDDTLKGTFPASDPPSSHLPDRPPSNAEAKWEAARLPRKPSNRRTAKPQAPRPQGR